MLNTYLFMARPIKETPILYGEDARRFEARMQERRRISMEDRPTVLHTEGYALDYRGKNQLDSIGEPMLVSVLDANCLQVEYRYHGWSLPEGYTNKWNYLTAKQHSDDLHAIVTAIKQSGVVGKNSKWLATGVSKNGMATAHYAYHYPNEMDAYVPFCAPFLSSLTDKRPYSYILTKEAFNENEEKMNNVKVCTMMISINGTSLRELSSSSGSTNLDSSQMNKKVKGYKNEKCHKSQC